MSLEITRREILQAGAAGSAALLVASSPGAALAAPRAVAPDAPYLRRSAYAVGMEIIAGGSVLRVEAVEDLAHGAARGLSASEEAFAILLSGPAGESLGQGVHAVQVPGSGAGELFIVPVGAGAGRPLYEIVVDRSVRLAGMDVPAPGAGSVAEPAAAPLADGDAAGAATPDPRFGFLKSVSLRRGRPGVRARLRTAKGSRLRHVTVQVVSGTTVVAQGGAPVRRNAAYVGLYRLGPVRRGGRYDVVITAVDRKGVRTVVRRSGILR